MTQELTKDEFVSQWAQNTEALAKAVQSGQTLGQMMNMPKENLSIIYRKAFDAFQVEDYSQAEDLFLSLMLWDFKEYAYQVGLAAALEAQDKFQNALGMYTLAMLVNGQNPEILYRSGKCLLAMEQRQEAKIMFELAVDFETQRPELTLATLAAIEKSKNMLSLING